MQNAEQRKLNFGIPLVLVRFFYQSAGPLSFRLSAGKRTSGPKQRTAHLCSTQSLTCGWSTKEPNKSQTLL
jgi:hypothetical protein